MDIQHNKEIDYIMGIDPYINEEGKEVSVNLVNMIKNEKGELVQAPWAAGNSIVDKLKPLQILYNTMQVKMANPSKRFHPKGKKDGNGKR